MNVQLPRAPAENAIGRARRSWADPRRHCGEVIAAAAETIRQRWRESLGTAESPTPRVAIILGTGLGGVANAINIDTEIPYGEIPPFVAPTAVAHRGRLLLGSLGGDPNGGDHNTGVPIVAFEGRVHAYEGHGLGQVVLPVEVAAALGAEVLIASNASGGLNPMYGAGDVVVVDDHLDFMFASPGNTTHSNTPRGGSGRNTYDRELVELAHRSARTHGGTAHRGVYAAVPGPNYETRAEIRMLRTIGADVVGMSTVPKAVAARALGMRVVALSVVTNQCNPDRVQHVTHAEVAESAARAEQLVGHIVRDLVAHVGPAPRLP
jgi:purine-nucleoside phosphorylase